MGNCRLGSRRMGNCSVGNRCVGNSRMSSFRWAIVNGQFSDGNCHLNYCQCVVVFEGCLSG